MTTTRQNILATKPAERAAAVAREIAKNRPDVVSLQEVMTLRKGTPQAPQATTIEFDVLKILLGELSKLGPPYKACVTVPGLDQEAPSSLGFNVRIATGDAIIAREPLCTFPVQVHQFTNPLTITLASGLQITIPHGWASLDAVIRGQPLRFVITHFDTPCFPDSLTVQEANARELLQSAGDTILPVVFARDFNATVDDPKDPSFRTYQIFINAMNGKFEDAWKKAHPNKPGFTCCQDQNLLNAASKLTTGST
ncbi:MAG TPA: endonuclease/exonuclease/phosphatase family protein [Methylocella sp.]|nr:endonuclease/exonuclease/phosphatase family protein [Methylocella sp.]